MSRAHLARPAVRPAMKAKALIAGPSGSGKTWTALSMMRAIVGPTGNIVVIDTEHESALTYADFFEEQWGLTPPFLHIPWHTPFDPSEFAETIIDLDMSPDVDGIIADSLSHFWTGQGGTLDIAAGKFTGWKGARPVQNNLLDVLCGLRTHAIYCTRSKTEYHVDDTKGEHYGVTRLGMAPVQDESLMFELNVAFDIDLDHRMTVTKSRSTAIPVGRMFPAGTQDKAADDYRRWLDGGVPPAAAGDVEMIIAWCDQVSDDDQRRALKIRFRDEIGIPTTLVAEAVPDAVAWLETNVGPRRAAESTSEAPGATTAPEPDEAATDAPVAADSATATPNGSEAPFETEDEATKRTELVAWCDSMKAAEVRVEAKAAGINDQGPHKEVRTRLVEVLFKRWQKDQAAADVPRETSDDPDPDEPEMDPIELEFSGA